MGKGAATTSVMGAEPPPPAVAPPSSWIATGPSKAVTAAAMSRPKD